MPARVCFGAGGTSPIRLAPETDFEIGKRYHPIGVTRAVAGANVAANAAEDRTYDAAGGSPDRGEAQNEGTRLIRLNRCADVVGQGAHIPTRRDMVVMNRRWML